MAQSLLSCYTNDERVQQRRLSLEVEESVCKEPNVVNKHGGDAGLLYQSDSSSLSSFTQSPYLSIGFRSRWDVLCGIRTSRCTVLGVAVDGLLSCVVEERFPVESDIA